MVIDHEFQIDENVQREIINHRSLRHPNIVRFKEVNQTSFQYLSISKCGFRSFTHGFFVPWIGHFNTDSSGYHNGICFWW